MLRNGIEGIFVCRVRYCYFNLKLWFSFFLIGYVNLEVESFSINIEFDFSVKYVFLLFKLYGFFVWFSGCYT